MPVTHASRRPSRPAGRRLATLVAVGILATLVVPTALASAGATTGSLYVSSAAGTTHGTGTQQLPFRTIQAALDVARPGTTIYLAAGTYAENDTTTVAGTTSEPITIQGPQRGTATVFGTSRVFDIADSHYVLRGFAIDGQQAVESAVPVSKWPTSLAAVDAFKDSVQSKVQNDRLLYIDGGAGPAVTGTRIEDMTLTGAGGECVRVRDDATDTIITGSTIRWCGMYGEQVTGVFTYHNGEGVYVGTSPKSTTLKDYTDDATDDTTVSDDVITTFGSECLDVKEHAHNNALTGSTCSDNTEPTYDYGSNVELRGYDNVVSGSTIDDSAGYGVKINADASTDPDGGNSVTGNVLSGQAGPAFYDKADAIDGATCGNTISSADTSTTPAWLAQCPATTPVTTTTPATSSTPAPAPVVARPKVSMVKLVRRTHRASVTFRWVVPRLSTARTFEVRWRDGRSVHALGAWRLPKSRRRSRMRALRLPMRRRKTYCAQVRAQSAAGLRSAWTPQMCVIRLK